MNVPIVDAFDDSDPSQLLSRVRAAHGRLEAPLATEIASFVYRLRNERDAYKREAQDLKRRLEVYENDASVQEPATKKRKLPIGSASETAGSSTLSTTSWHQYRTTFEVREISFSLPVRKKLTLQFVEGPSNGDGGIRIKAPGNAEEDVFLSWNDMEQIICVPVPEKAQPSSQFIIIPRPSSESQSPPTIMWAAPHTPPKNPPLPIDMGPDHPTPAIDYATNPLDTTIRLFLDAHLALTPNKPRTILPDPREFTSALVQAHRKAEKAHHIKAHRGSKEGYLYLLPTGILFAPRTPLLYFPFRAVTSISYSSVLQRTFNLNISARGAGAGAGADTEQDAEYEFAMLDQADFGGVDAYVKRHGLHDASLAAHRRAKFYNVNPAPASAAPSGDAAGERELKGANGAADGDGDESEAVMAERALQDAEDEQEEDYDPSGGESEGSGSESEEEEQQQEQYADRDVDEEDLESEEELDVYPDSTLEEDPYSEDA